MYLNEHFKTNKKDLVESNLQNLIRGSISNAPAFGAEIMSMIFNDDIDSWKNELESARSDLVSRRKQFCEALALDLPALQNGKGMFGLLPLNKNQIAELKEKYAIYIPDNGRISFGGMAPNKIQYLAEKIRNIL